jgi:hypothetical protein
MSNFSAISWREQVTVQWNDDDVRLVLQVHQYALLDFYSALLKEQAVGRYVRKFQYLGVLCRSKAFVFCVAFFLNGDWFKQRGQTPMFARKIIYAPYFYLQKRNHVRSFNEFSSKTRLSLIDRMTKHKN